MEKNLKDSVSLKCKKIIRFRNDTLIKMFSCPNKSIVFSNTFFGCYRSNKTIWLNPDNYLWMQHNILLAEEIYFVGLTIFLHKQYKNLVEGTIWFC